MLPTEGRKEKKGKGKKEGGRILFYYLNTIFFRLGIVREENKKKVLEHPKPSHAHVTSWPEKRKEGKKGGGRNILNSLPVPPPSPWAGAKAAKE